MLVLRLLVHRYCRIVLTKPPPPLLSELRWLEVGSSQTLRVARLVQQMPASRPTNGHTTAYREASRRGPRRPRIVTRVLGQSEWIQWHCRFFFSIWLYLPLASVLVAKLLLSLLLGVTLGLLAVNEVESLGLNLAVDEETNGTGKDLLCLSVLVRVAYTVKS